MKQKKFAIILLVLLGIAVGYYFYSTDRTSDTVLIGIVDANQVIVSSKIMGRVEKLNVDEGSKVKAGDLIAIMTAGAYGAVQSGTYNTRALIPEVLVKDDQYAVVRPRVDVDALIALDKPAPWL